ncbi:hypothetical protein NC652_031805 [Populus alba x Populus x berolinensis]|nr:hypothetical protein NC652_031805 [Populus alba x Populus x berolinensis]
MVMLLSYGQKRMLVSIKNEETQFASEKNVKPDDKLTSISCVEKPARVCALMQSFEARQLPRRKISGFHTETEMMRALASTQCLPKGALLPPSGPSPRIN